MNLDSDLPDQAQANIAGRCLLVVEDNFLVADTLCRDLTNAGVTVVGPCATVNEALSLLNEQGSKIEGAILDVHLRGAPSYPIADELVSRGIPFVFVTGYASPMIDCAYASVQRYVKPVDVTKLAVFQPRS